MKLTALPVTVPVNALDAVAVVTLKAFEKGMEAPLLAAADRAADAVALPDSRLLLLSVVLKATRALELFVALVLSTLCAKEILLSPIKRPTAAAIRVFFMNSPEGFEDDGLRCGWANAQPSHQIAKAVPRGGCLRL